MKRYWLQRKMHLLSAEKMRNLRLHPLFYEDTTGKLVLPEDTIYRGDSTDDTIEHLGNVTKPLTIPLTTPKLPALKINRTNHKTNQLLINMREEVRQPYS